MININKITMTYKHGIFNSFTALDNINFEIKAGTVFGIAGNSGCGKSTLARIIMGLLKPTYGEINIDGKNIETLNRKDISKYIQIIFQHPESSFDPKMKFGDSLVEALKIGRSLKIIDIKNKINEFTSLVGLSSDLLERYPHEVSGGEAQRFSIVRALSLEPKILLLDEATSMLDVSVQAKIFEILMNMREKFNITLIIISHDLEVLTKVCDELLIMNDGKIVEIGITENILKNPKSEYTKKLIENFGFFL